MKRIILLILTGICFQISFGQIFIGRQVISSTGGSSGSGAIRATSTVGETVTGTFVQPSLVVTQGFQQTNASVSPSNQDVTFNAGTTNFTVNVPAGSGWAATSDKFWCSVTPAGSGIGIVTANYLENELLDQRIAYITVTISGHAPVIVTVTQSGAPGPSSWIPLPYPENNMSVIGKIQLSPGVYSLNENDILGAFVGNECRGVASPFSSLGGILFLTIGSNEESGEIVTFKIYLASTNEIVDANNEIPFVSSTDIGTMDDPIIFTYGLQCELSVTPSNQNVPYSPNGSTTFSVTTSCSWSATSDQEWCSVTPSGTGNGTMIANYIVNPTTSERTANITVSVVGIAPKVVTVTQSPAPCSLAANPSNQNVPYSPGSSTTFSISSNCPWTATSDKEWCTVTPSGAGNGTMDATYTENNTNLERIATINLAIAGVPSFVVTVTQSGLPGTSDNIILHAGWNLISLDVIPDPSTPESVFNQLIGNENLIVVTGYDQDGLIFDPNDIPELNTLVNLTPGMGYWVKVINEAELNITGAQIQPSFSINLTTGWNLVAYWPEEPLPPEDAFGSLITAGILQVVTGYDQDGQIFEPNELYFNTLTEIRNGYGFWVKVTADYDGFTYPQTEWYCGMPIHDERDYKTYETVQIGNQCWMAESLNIGAYLHGSIEQSNNGIIEKYCYNNIETNCDVYGGLYLWDEVMQYSTIEELQGICPSNWHLPSVAEWTTLTDFLGGISIAGGKMKETGITHWFSPNTGATNSSGFTGLPSGMREPYGLFNGIGGAGQWWSSTEYDIMYDYGRSLSFNGEYIGPGLLPKGYGISVRCLNDEYAQVIVPTVTTSEITTITSTSAISGGDVTFDGGATVTARGVCWSTSQNPTIENSFTINGTGTGSFTSNITSLVPGTTYYLRSYATNSEGTAYGNELSFSTPTLFLCGDNFTDSRNSKVYTTVQIGVQCWMKQNLNIGARIDGTNNQINNGTIEKYCYNNLESNCDVYGGLYQWDEMMQYSTIEGVKGICSSGWHIPSNNEWTTLTTQLGGESVAGGKMKEIGTTHWSSPNSGATNSSGFIGLPGGIRSIEGSFLSLGNFAWFWSSSQDNGLYAFTRYLHYTNSVAGFIDYNLPAGFSVRCLKDENYQVSVPTVTTYEITEITSTSAMSGGDVTLDGGATVTARGLCWSTSQNPTIENSYTINGTGTGIFISDITGLTPGTTSYVRAYATNSVGTAYGNEFSFSTPTTFLCGNNFTDSRDGRVYTTVQIGTRCWMKQNLNVGTRINGTSSQTNNGTIEKYCYNNLETNCDVYGGLYQWDEMMEYNSQMSQGICPEGWLIPNDLNFTELIIFLGGYDIAGCSMKESGTLYWNPPNVGATNSSGFTGLPGGIKVWGAGFIDIHKVGYFWTSTENEIDFAWIRSLSYEWGGVAKNYSDKQNAQPIRCIRISN